MVFHRILDFTRGWISIPASFFITSPTHIHNIYLAYSLLADELHSFQPLESVGTWLDDLNYFCRLNFYNQWPIF